MSQHTEKDKRNRSIKLCQLVHDRQIDSEIGFEIRKLLEQGVSINFQDQNRNRKAAIHLAVDKRDVICVKFLLRFKPNLEVKDEDGKTPAVLAESNGNQNVLDVLLNSTVDIVNESYVEVFDFESVTPQKIEAIKSRASFKVLKLTNCPSADHVWKKLSDQDYAKAFNGSSHLFFIAIETSEADIQNDHELMKNALNLRRPMIVQLTASDIQDSKIYFKDDSKKDFVEISDIQQITQEEFTEAVKNEEDCNLLLLVAALRSNLFGHFTGDLLDTKLKTNEDRNEAVNQFARSNALCHRFLMMFEENQPQIKRIIATLSFKGDQSLLALLDLPFELKGEKLKLNEYQQDILTVVGLSGCNLLMMAAELANLDAVKLLLRCCCDFNRPDNYDKRAADICWEMKAFDYLAELIEAGSPYPSNFYIDEVDHPGAHDRINKMIEAINSFHENIEDRKTEEVEKFIASHPHIKHAYDTKNKCALTVALESKEVDIYSLLMSKRFEPGADDEYYETFRNFNDKELITKSYRKYFTEAFEEPHLKRLLNKYRLSFGSKDRAKCSTIIRKMFDELNEIDELIPILQICSLSDELQIVFDFNCKSVVDVDPTQGQTEMGVTLSDIGFVYIGAKNHETEFFEVIGTLIHELMHYAMKLAYENGCKPYIDDIEDKRKFDITTKNTKKICDENSSTDAIVTRVFCYKPEVWHQELIVRVPQLLAHYKTNSKAREAAERNTPELFQFYREETLKDLERISKVWQQKHVISKINNQTGVARRIENTRVEFLRKFLNVKIKVLNIITSNAPQLTLAMLKQVYRSDSNIFVSLEQIALEQVALENISKKIGKVNAMGSPTALIVDCTGQAQKYQNKIRELLQDMKNFKTIALVMTVTESSKVRENFPEVELKTFPHKWDELTESSKVHLLDQNVIFQGEEMKLNELVEPSSEAMNFFPLGELVDMKEFKIGHELIKPSHKFYIPRKFIKKGQESLSLVAAEATTFAELLNVDPKMGAMIISDDAGGGKSVALIEIAKSLHASDPHRYVLFVDLKRHIEAFKGVEKNEMIVSFVDFIVQNILNNKKVRNTSNDDKSDDDKEIKMFNRELFKKMFRAGKTFVLFDGFDEICPNYEGLLLQVLKRFNTASGNQLFITTRPHLEAALEGALGKFVFKIENFSKEDQRDLLREYLGSVKPEMNQEGFEDLSKQLLAKFFKIASLNIIGLPLLMLLTAEIFEDPNKENLLHKFESLSITSVFDEFLKKHFLKWISNENENVKFVISGEALEVHHRIALNHIFGENFMSFKVDESEADKIARAGLIRFNKIEKTFEFTHETFAEYFVADFIWFHLNRKNRDPAHECIRAIQTFCEIVVKSDFDTNVIKHFLDEILKTNNFIPEEAFVKSVAECLSEILKNKDKYHVLSFLLLRARPGNVKNLVLLTVKHFERRVLMETIQSKNLFRVIVYGNIIAVSTWCDLIKSCSDEAKKILKQVDSKRNNNILLSAARNEKKGVLSALSTNLKNDSILTKDEIKIMFKHQNNCGQNIVGVAANNRNFQVFEELISLLPDYLSAGEIESLLLAVDHQDLNFFHQSVTRDSKMKLNRKFDVIKLKFGNVKQKIFEQPSTASNIFLCAARNKNKKIFEAVIEFTNDMWSAKKIKSMLKEKDSDGSNVLHIIAERGNDITLKELNALLRDRDRLSNEEITKLLLEVNKGGKNCILLALNNAELTLQMFRETIGHLLPIEDRTRLLLQSIHEIDIWRFVHEINEMEILPDEIIKHLLSKQDENGRNAFQKVAYKGDVDTWNKLISFAHPKFSEDVVKGFLFCCDNYGRNCISLAVYGRDKNIIETICKTIKSVGLSVEDQKKFVRQIDSKNENVFHHAVAINSVVNFKSLYDCLSTIISKEEIKEMLKEIDSDGNNVICANCKYRNNDEPDDLLRFLEEVLTPKDPFDAEESDSPIAELDLRDKLISL